MGAIEAAVWPVRRYVDVRRLIAREIGDDAGGDGTKCQADMTACFMLKQAAILAAGS